MRCRLLAQVYQGEGQCIYGHCRIVFGGLVAFARGSLAAGLSSSLMIQIVLSGSVPKPAEIAGSAVLVSEMSSVTIVTPSCTANKAGFDILIAGLSRGPGDVMTVYLKSIDARGSSSV